MSSEAHRIWDVETVPDPVATDVTSERLASFLEAEGFERLGAVVVERRELPEAAHADGRRVRHEAWRSADQRVAAAPTSRCGVDVLALVSALSDGSVVRTLWVGGPDPRRRPLDALAGAPTAPMPAPRPLRRRRPAADTRWRGHHPRSGVWSDRVSGPLDEAVERHAERVVAQVRASGMTTVRLEWNTVAAIWDRGLALDELRRGPLAVTLGVAMAGPTGVALYGALGWVVASVVIGMQSGEVPDLPPEAWEGLPWIVLAGGVGAWSGWGWNVRLPLAGASWAGILILSAVVAPLSSLGAWLVAWSALWLGLGFLWGGEGAAQVVGSQGLGPGLERLNLHQLRLRYGFSDPPSEP